MTVFYDHVLTLLIYYIVCDQVVGTMSRFLFRYFSNVLRQGEIKHISNICILYDVQHFIIYSVLIFHLVNVKICLSVYQESSCFTN